MTGETWVKLSEIRFFLVILLAMAVAGAADEPVEDAQTIVRRADSHFRGQTAKAEMSMSIVRPDWSREVSMKSWSNGEDYALILITGPARDKGTVFLKRGNEVWHWVPSIAKVIKLPPSMMMQSWMGSDFTNDDLVRESSVVNDYTHEIIGDSSIDERDCYIIRMVPKEDAAVVWGELKTWISKEGYLQLRTEFYDEDKELTNVLRLSQVEEMGGRVIPTLLEMIPVNEEGQKTVVEYHSIEFDEPIPESFFSEQNMKRVR
jgi:outer membrane lipoprotein-sorting protein